MKELFQNIINLYFAPIRNYPISFGFFAILLMLPNLIGFDIPRIIANFRYCNNWFILCVVISYILVAFAYVISKLNKKAAGVLILFLHLFIYILVFSDIFLFKYFGTHINAYTLQLIDETNSQESSEFLQTYIHTKKFAKISIFFVFLVGVEIALSRFRTIFHRVNFRDAWRSGLGMGKSIISVIVGLYTLSAFVVVISNRFCFTLDWETNLEKDLAHDIGYSYSFAFRTFQAGLLFLDERSSSEKSAQAHKHITATADSVSVQNIVVIVGESFNRHHSSLYGYDHVTNPRLSKFDHLYVFDDVISPANNTTRVFQSFFSMASMDDSLAWYDAPFFPAFFKKLGYNVTFFSNQYVKLPNMSPYDASAGFFNRPDIEPHIFSHRNDQKHKYDEGLIEEYKSKRDEVENDSFNLVFFHLIGQHISAALRFPEGRDYFQIADYHRPELNEEQIQKVADYDNATLYNDSVVSEIFKMFQDKDALLLYFADHGDEANDYRPYLGRCLNLNEAGAPGLHCQLDIPFLIYLTDSCCMKHPDLENRIAMASHLPFMIDDLPHFLLDIADIETPWFKSSKSPIDENYDSNRPRIISGFHTTQDMNYDTICDSYGDWRIGY